MTLFGIVFSVGEILALLSLFVGAVTAYAGINNKLMSIIERNRVADIKMEHIENDLNVKLTGTRVVLEARVSAAEVRISGQEISGARIDEKLTAMQHQLTRLLDILERSK